MNPLPAIFNRAVTAGRWIHIVPKGELPNSEAGVVQVLDDVALDSILANIEADRQRLGSRWPGVYAGREHHIYDSNKSSEALAWFKKFEKRDDGIWANDDGLTDIGRDAIHSGRFKFTSFVVDRKDTQPLGGKRVRVLKIDTVGFTNQANGKELLTPITNCVPEKASAAMSPGGFETRLNLRGTTPTQRHQRCAAERLREIAQGRARNRGTSFDTEWQAACREFPDLNGKSAGKIFNRSLFENPVDKSDWKFAEKKAPEALAWLSDEMEITADRGRTVSNPNQLRGLMKRALLRLETEEEMSREEAFEFIKKTEPVFWAKFVISYDKEPEPEPVKIRTSEQVY